MRFIHTFNCAIRFYGPSKTPISPQIQPLLEQWLESTQSSLEFDEFGEDEEVTRTRRRYLFCMKSDRNRCMSTSLWSDRVKNAFQRHSPNHTSTAPSLLRSAFITWMRDNTDDPEIYAQAAIAQKHSVRMQGENAICMIEFEHPSQARMSTTSRRTSGQPRRLCNFVKTSPLSQ
jgi:hypothetical protein